MKVRWLSSWVERSRLFRWMVRERYYGQNIPKYNRPIWRHSKVPMIYKVWNINSTSWDYCSFYIDGERLPLSIKDMGPCEIYPQTLQHSSNGRFVVACGDGEYIILTAIGLRNKAFGSGLEFVWGADPAVYAVRESATSVKLFRNFKVSTIVSLLQFDVWIWFRKQKFYVPTLQWTAFTAAHY